MSKLTLTCAVLLGTSILAGCSLLQPERRSPPELPLLAPTAHMPSELLKQRLTLQAKEHEQSFITLVKITPEKTSLVALTPAGQSFLSQSYDGLHWSSENISGQALPERDIFAMMQFSLWPKEQVKQAYQATPDWQVNITPDTRQAYFHGQAYMTATLTPDGATMEHIPGQYHVDIQTFDKEPLEP